MRILHVMFFLLAISVTSSAQVREILEELKPKKKFTGTPIVQKKSHLISFGASAPNNLSSFLNLGGLASLFGSTEKKHTGPFLISYEYLLKENIGIGITVSYASATQTYKNLLGLGTITGDIRGFSFLASTYYHLHTTDKIDAYTKGSIGVNIWKGSYKDQSNNEVQKFVAPTPVAYNALLGLRYFVSPKMNLAGEVSYSNLRFTAGINLGFKLN
jgi:hypothetical protein